MMNNNYNINSYADLEREEIRVRKRLKKQEEIIKIKIKSLPQEIIITGISKIVSGILSGEIVKSTVSIFKTVGSVFSEIKSEGSHSGGLINIIKNLVKGTLSK